MTLPSFLSLLVLFTVPGLAARATFPSLQREESFGEALFGILFVSILASGWIAFVLAELGAFSLIGTVALALVFSAVIVVARRWTLQSPFARTPIGPRITPWRLAALVVLGAAAWLYLRPNEYVLGGRDHGVYVNTGVTLARTGGFPLSDPLWADLSVDQRAALIEPTSPLRNSQIQRTWHEGVSTTGYYLFHLDSPQAVPHGFHLYPTWLALLDAASGVEFSLYLTPALAWLSLVAILLTARRAFGRRVAVLAVALIVVNLAQLWYARTPSAEILVQFLFWAGAWAWIRAIQTEEAIFGLLGGLAWGQIHLAKIDYVFLTVVVVAWAGWAWWIGRYRPFHTAGLIAYGAMAAHAALHGLFTATSYTFNTVSEFAPAGLMTLVSSAAQGAASPLDFVIRLIANSWPILAVAVAVLVLLWIALRRVQERGAAVWARFVLSPWGWLGLAGLLLGAGVILFTRRSSLTELSWYLGTLTVALGLIGFAHRLGRASTAQGMLWWSVFGLSAVYLVGGSLTYPDHFWAARRYVPIVIPGLLLLAGDVLLSITPRRMDDWRQALVPCLLAGGMFLNMAEATRPFVQFVENGGTIERLAKLAQDFEPDAVLLFDRDASGAQVGTPLQMIFERSVGFVGDEVQLAALASEWQGIGRSVYYLSSAIEPTEIPGFSLNYVRTEVIARQAAEHIATFRPTRMGEVADTFDVYRIVPEPEVETRVVTLDVGPDESAPWIDGVYSDPLVPGLSSVQWTSGTASFTFRVEGRPSKMRLRMGGLPSVVPSIDVDVTANGVSLGRIAVHPSAMDVYTIPFPDDMAAADSVVVELRMNTWNPHALGYNADRRDLGVLMDWIKVVVTRP